MNLKHLLVLGALLIFLLMVLAVEPIRRARFVFLIAILVSPLWAPWLAVYAKRLCWRAFWRWCEDRVLVAPRFSGESEPGSSLIFSLAATSSLLLLFLLACFSIELSEFLQLHAWLVDWLIVLPGFVLAPFALLLHVSGIARRLKYELLLASSMFHVFIVAAFRMELGFSKNPTLWFFGNMASWLLFMGTQVGIGKLVARHLGGRHSLRWFYWLRSRICLFLGISVNHLLLWTYLVARFHVINDAACRPILFFRSFRLPHSSRVFSQLIVKATRRYGVIEGLVASEQRSSDLQERVNLDDHARFKVVADEWPSWVLSRLKVASLVIIDATCAAESVRWELDQSIEIVGSSRVVVLYQESEMPTQIRDGVQYIPYSLGYRDIKRARQQLEGWVRSRLVERSEQDDSVEQATFSSEADRALLSRHTSSNHLLQK